MRRNTAIELDVNKNVENGVKFYVKQFDDLRLKVKIYDGLDEVEINNQDIAVYIVKEDKTIIEQRKDIRVEDNTLIADLTKQATTALGKCHMEIALKDEEGITSTCTVSYMVGEKLSTTISEIIKSEDDVDILDMIEEFIQNSNIDIVEIKEALTVLKADIKEAKGSINADLEDVLAKIKEIEETTLANITDTANEAVEKVDEAVIIANETLNTVNSIKEEVEKLDEDIEDALNDIASSKDGVLDEIAGAAVIIEDTKEQAIVDIGDAKTNAIGSIENARVKSIEDIDLSKSEAVLSVNEIKEGAITSITELKESVEANVEGMINTIEEARDEAVGTVETVKDASIKEIGTVKSSSIEEMTEAKDALIEEITNTEAGTIEEVELAVEQARERLQELTIQSTWEVLEKAEEGKDALEAVSREQQGIVKEKTNEQIGKINKAGADMVELVETLDVNIDAGLSEINNTVSTGKSEINQLSSEKLKEIREEGQEIVDMVSGLDMNVSDALEEISTAKYNAINSIESFAGSEKSSINSTASERKEEINELTSEKLESITNAGDAKLEEIESIVGTTKTDVFELLDQTRTEIQTHRTEIATVVNVGKDEIGTLKNNSINEMNSKAEELVEEILNAEINMKNDFTELAEGYKTQINELGGLKVENLQNMIEAIDALEEAVSTKLEASEERTENIRENFNNIFESTDDKMAEIRPIIAMLDELRNVCVALQQENQESNNNIDELQNLHIEADTRIVEMRRLIDLAKHYEEVVQRYIDKKSGNHEEIEARLLALEEIITSIDLSLYATTEYVDETVSNIEIPSVEGLASEEYVDNKVEEAISNIEVEVDLSDYPTKTEVEKLLSGASGGFVGSLGAGLYTPDIPEYFNEVPIPDFEPTATFKYTHIYYRNSYDYYVYDTVIYFKTNIEDLDNGKYIYFDSQGRINYSKLIENEDYIMYIKNALSSTSKWELTSKREFYADPTLKRTRIYSHNFNIYDETGLNIVYQDTTRGGINDLDKATKSGDYSIDMSEEDFNSLLNGVKLGTGKHITGTLNVKAVGANIVQSLNLHSINKYYTRILGQDWVNIDNNSIQKESVATVGANNVIEMSPYFSDVPKSPLYGRKVDKVVKICDNNAWYYVFYLYEGWDATNPIFYLGETGSINLNVHQSKCIYYRRLVNSNGVGDWQEYLLSDSNTTMSYISSSKIDKIKIYESPLPFRRYNTTGEIYYDAVIRNDTVKIINDYNNVLTTGNYEVSYTSNDEVFNAPVNELNGVLEVVAVGNKTLQRVITNECNVYIRVYSGNVWTEWKEIIM